MFASSRVFASAISYHRKRWRKLAGSVAAFVLLAGMGQTALAGDEAGARLALRGSSDVISVPQRQSGYSTRMHVHGPTYGDAPPLLRHGNTFDAVGEVAEGLFEGAAHSLSSGFHAVIFRGSHEAVEERDVSISLPGRVPLRRSMLHASDYSSGLRSGTATIADTMSAALRGSYSARQTIERSNADRARMYAAVGNFLPKLEANITANRARRYSVSTGLYDQDNASASLELSVPLFTSGVNLNTYRQARHVSIAADYSHLAEEQKVALESVAAHVNLRLNRRIEQTLARNVSAMQRIADIARRLFEAGDASRTDIAIARANVESARAELDIGRRSREETQVDYASLTGHPAPKDLSLARPADLLPPSIDDAVNSALAANPALLSAQHSALASDYEALATRGRFGPQVSGFARYNHTLHDSLNDEREDDWEFGVQVRVPLVDFTAIPTIDAARHQAVEARYSALEQSRLIRRQVERQWSAYHSAKRRVSIVQRQVNAVAASVEGARREYEAGFRSITDVLTDQVKLARAQITLENARHEMILAAYELAFTTSHERVQHLASFR